MNALQVKGQHQEEYKKVLETGTLGPHLIGRDSSVIHGAEDKLEDIGTSNLIFVFSKFGFWSAPANCAETIIGVTRKPRSRSLQIPYALFYRESESYRYVGQNHVRVSSEDTVGIIHEAARVHIGGTPQYNTRTGYNVIVYEVQ